MQECLHRTSIVFAPDQGMVPGVNPRFAAGAGVLSAFLLLSGSGAAVAIAHPGHSHGSDRGHSSDRGGSPGRGSNNGKAGAERRDFDNGRDNSSRGGSATPGAPSSRVGSGRSESPPSSSNRSATAGSPAPAARSSASAPNASGPNRPTTESAPVVSSGPRPAAEGGAESTSGSDRPDAPAAVFEAPQVGFGNGRTPVYGGDAPRSPWQPSAPAPVAGSPALPPPPVSPPPSAPSLGDRVATSSAIARQFVGVPAAEPGGPLWGIAGLLLIPAAGAALGYRQARAAQAAERMRRV